MRNSKPRKMYIIDIGFCPYVIFPILCYLTSHKSEYLPQGFVSSPSNGPLPLRVKGFLIGSGKIKKFASNISDSSFNILFIL